jgi:hypothetical protein
VSCFGERWSSLKKVFGELLNELDLSVNDVVVNVAD